MSFKDEIRQAVMEVRQRALHEQNPYVQALGDLAEALTTDTIVADVSPARGQRWKLRVCPRHRPAQAALLLSVAVENGKVVVMTDERREFSTRESFENYLKDLVRLDGFISDLDELERQSREPVEAHLRVLDPQTISRDDLMLIVTPEDQRRLSEASESTDLELELEVGSAVGAGAYKTNVTYQFLISAGLVLVVTDTSRTPDGKIRVKGRRAALGGAPGSVYRHLSDEELRDVGLKLATSLRGLVSIYRRDKAKLDDAPNETTRRKALHYAPTVDALEQYICDQYAMSGVRVRECKQELTRRLGARAPEEPPVDLFRPDDPLDIERIADFLEAAARILAPSS